MKKHAVLIFVIGCIWSLNALAQNIHLPNSSFEVWDNLAGLIDVPDSWPSSDLLWYNEGYNTRNVYADSHSHSGKFSARIGPDTAAGKIWPGFIAAEFPVHQRAKYFSFYYIDSLNNDESGVVQISIFKWNTATKTDDSIGGASWDFPDSTISDFTFAEIPLNYAGSDTTIIPDSISVNIEVVSKASSKPSGHIAVDDLGLSVKKTAGIAIPIYSDDFKLFPNPSSGIIQLVPGYSVYKPYRFDVADIRGQIICSKSLNGELYNQIDLSQFPNGIYIVKIFSDNAVSEKEIVINH